MPDLACAVWFVRDDVRTYKLFEGEREAADWAASNQDVGDCTVVSVQYPSGRTVSRDDWAAYHAAVARRRGTDTTQTWRECA